MKILLCDDEQQYIEALKIHIEEFLKSRSISFERETFDEWSEILQNSFFYKVHKSFIINLHYVTSYKYSEIFIQNNIRIPIASRRQADFHKFWFAYLRRR